MTPHSVWPKRWLSRLRTRLYFSVPRDFRHQYILNLDYLEKNSRGFRVFDRFHYDVGSHPRSYIDHECEFAAQNLAINKPTTVLDIGSYRHFVIGLLAAHPVITIDIRKRDALLKNETILTCDAKHLDIDSNTVGAVISLCALEHFGLGRYGDPFDQNGDQKAFKEMIRVLKPGGALIFSTTITKAAPSIVFNAHRIYDYRLIQRFCKGLTLAQENFFSQKMGRACALEEVTTSPNKWDVYCGCWVKC